MESKIFFLHFKKNEIMKILDKSDCLTQGLWLRKFQNKFIKFLNYKGSTFAMTSGASAIEIAASLLRLKKYDEVIIPSHTYCATALPFTRYNCQIRWADIVPEIFYIDINSIKKLITTKTKAIIAVHLYGFPCNILEIKKIFKYK